jgi:uncharacterized protein (DUF2225 family)
MMRTQKKPEVVKDKKVTYFKKDPIRCPVCDKPFQREELFQGRVNAASLTDELHRLYAPMAAYGEVMPLIYPVTVCPNCYFAALSQDFETLNPKVKPALSDGISARIDAVGALFPNGLDFAAPRRLEEGIASYFLAMQCYEQFLEKDAPVIKQALCALRLAWLLADLDKKIPKQNYDYLSTFFYKKATFLYQYGLDLDTKGKQALSLVKFLGPDTDMNYGYDGVLYLCAKLELKYGQTKNAELREQRLNFLLMAIAKMFGLGRKTKSKPGPLLEKARELYDELKAVVKGEEGEESAAEEDEEEAE